MQKNYEMVEVLNFNVDEMNKALYVDRNICMDMENIGHKNETVLFRNRTKAFIDGMNQN